MNYINHKAVLMQRCARFAEFLQNWTENQIFERMSGVIFSTTPVDDSLFYLIREISHKYAHIRLRGPHEKGGGVLTLGKCQKIIKPSTPLINKLILRFANVCEQSG